MDIFGGRLQATPHLAGCCPAAQQVLRTRYPPILAFLQAHLGVTDEWRGILSPALREMLHARLMALEQHVIQSRLGHLEADTAAHRHYRQTYLTPLAQSLGLVVRIQDETLARCWQGGWLTISRRPRSA